jgi:hypothetical protein
METAEVMSVAPGDDEDASRLRRFTVIVGDAAHGGAALRIEDPALLLRIDLTRQPRYPGIGP